jgi:hypothetical protein
MTDTSPAPKRTTITEKDGVHPKWYVEAKKQTAETLPEFIRHLIEDYGHDYGTICHAIAAAAVAGAYAVEHSPVGGITGFQGGAVMWQFIAQWGGYEDKPLRLVNYSDLLYPQYADKFTTISATTWEWAKKQAAEKLAEYEAEPVYRNEETGETWPSVHPDVVRHWRSVAAGTVPFGLEVEMGGAL